MVGPKKQDFWPRINILKGSIDELRFVKKCQNCTFKVNFECQRSTVIIKIIYQDLGDHFFCRNIFF